MRNLYTTHTLLSIAPSFLLFLPLPFFLSRIVPYEMSRLPTYGKSEISPRRLTKLKKTASGTRICRVDATARCFRTHHLREIESRRDSTYTKSAVRPNEFKFISFFRFVCLATYFLSKHIFCFTTYIMTPYEHINSTAPVHLNVIETKTIQVQF